MSNNKSWLKPTRKCGKNRFWMLLFPRKTWLLVTTRGKREKNQLVTIRNDTNQCHVTAPRRTSFFMTNWVRFYLTRSFIRLLFFFFLSLLTLFSFSLSIWLIQVPTNLFLSQSHKSQWLISLLFFGASVTYLFHQLFWLCVISQLIYISRFLSLTHTRRSITSALTVIQQCFRNCEW